MAFADTLRTMAQRWRDENPEYQGGVVLIWQESVYGWKNCLRDAKHEQPGVFAVDLDGNIYKTEGGNSYDGAKLWIVYQDFIKC